MQDNPPDIAAALQRLVTFFEKLQPGDLSALGQLYASQASFKDPFNEVQGLAAIQHIFADMFEVLDQPHFVVTTQLVQGHQCFLLWDFRFRFKRHQPEVWQNIRGCTHLDLDAQGLVISHRDYWDAAEELYEKLPVIGSLMRWLKRRARAA